MLFNFKLTALDQVRPWGDSSLHWFGLTDGEYWMRIGDVALLEYSEAARRELGCRRYCDYYVVRLYEDFLEILPHILEPVPERLQSYVSLELADWGATQDMADDAIFDRWLAATSWIGHRRLDTGYLTPSAGIRLWSDDANNIHIEWDNRRKQVEGRPVWTASHGAAVLSRWEFMREARAFHDTLMRQMAERVERVLAGALQSSVEIDLEGLKRDHATRCGELDRALRPLGTPTDWDRVWAALKEIEREQG